ncbi:MAG: hydroxymethylbilane synthase [Deltaproteobacteria bacterium]|nr:hydroxymethylbilane synthase [Deltaproteobacteria bacterium]
MKKCVIGTRGSPLALKQAHFVREKMMKHYPKADISLSVIQTTGDKLLKSALALQDKGIFVKEIEEALLARKIDVAVHSLKDVPTEIPKELEASLVLKRTESRDAFVSFEFEKMKELPAGAILGTSSLRRKVQIRYAYPTLAVIDIRGNVDTRLKKLEQGVVQGLVLSAVGLERLNLKNKIREYLDFIPAVGQGAMVLEIRKADHSLKEALSFLHDEKTAKEVFLERLFLKQMGGGCQVPLGALARCEEKEFFMKAFIGSLDGKHFLEHKIKGLFVDAEKEVSSLSQTFLNRGASFNGQ